MGSSGKQHVLISLGPDLLADLLLRLVGRPDIEVSVDLEALDSDRAEVALVDERHFPLVLGRAQVVVRLPDSSNGLGEALVVRDSHTTSHSLTGLPDLLRLLDRLLLRPSGQRPTGTTSG